MDQSDGVVRIVFATIALGMGVNLRVNTIIHYGAPRSIDDYFQESGRGGRTGNYAVYCVLDTIGLSTKERSQIRTAVTRYLENVTMCRRQWLLDYFDPICTKPGLVPSKCCDICATKTEIL